MNFIKSVFLLVVLSVVTSCSVSKHLPADAKVITKTKIKIETPDVINNPQKVKNEVLALARPKPASGIGKWQTNLYNNFSRKVKRDSTGKEKGIRGWAIRKIGLPPVLFEARKVVASRFRMTKYFKDNGYFGTTIKADTTLKNKEVTVTYHIYPKQEYFLRNIHLPKDSIELVKKLFSSDNKSLLVPGDPYSQENLTDERERLSELANNLGFLNVTNDHFYFFVDTALESHQVDIHVQIKQPKDSSTFKPFHLNDNIVFASYSISIAGVEDDTTIIDRYKIIQQNNIVRPNVIANIIGGEPGELYSSEKQDYALARLLDLGIYKFVNLKINQTVSDSGYLFNREFYLTPGLMQDVSAEFEAISRSTSYFGIASTVTYSHKNIFRGAERLDLSVSGGVGTQSNNTERLLNTLDGAIELSFTFPRLITPFKFKSYKRATIPKTRTSIGTDYQRRVEYYTVSSFILKYGYDWSKNPQRQHQFFPFNINLFNVLEITDSMEVLFIDNPRLEKSFSNVFILGLYYNYTISTQTDDLTKDYIYLRTGFETSGNIANLIIHAIGNQQQRPYEIFGAPFSQFIRVDGDFRYYRPLKNKTLVTRLFTGIGIPYGNSEVLPYIRQYSVGGPSSIRAFQYRGLGPGSFVPPDREDNSFIEQTGDIRLEGNIEYRFPLISYFKGAVFCDAGNIWLLNEGEDNSPEGVFKFDQFYKEIAVGTGLGLRFDLNFLVVRLDVAFPLRKPYLEEGNRWVISDIDFTSKAWRNQNVQWNFAIGYPF